MEYNSNVKYCENSDFDDNGKLVTPDCDGTVFIVLQANFCGHCRKNKPIWQKLADDSEVKSSVVMACVSNDDDEDLVARISSGKFPFKLEGFPTIIYYKNRNFQGEYGGSRDFDSMKTYILKHA